MIEIIEAIRTFFNTWSMPISEIASIVAIAKVIYSAFRALKNGKVKTPKPLKENQLGDYKAAQYINKRNLLIFQAKQEAKKRPNTLFGNLAALCLFVALLCAPVFIYTYGLLPLSVKEYLGSSYFFVVLYSAWLLVFVGLIIFVCPLLLFNVPTWENLIKKIRERKSFKDSEKEGCYVPISQAIDIASDFDVCLLFNAVSSEKRPKRRVIAEKRNRVIGATNVHEEESICDMIEPYLSEKLVVFIYSQHGKASYEQTQKARKRYPYVYDLGPVCGDMGELEIMAHQLHYLQDGKCLRLP